MSGTRAGVPMLMGGELEQFGEGLKVKQVCNDYMRIPCEHTIDKKPFQ